MISNKSTKFALRALDGQPALRFVRHLFQTSEAFYSLDIIMKIHIFCIIAFVCFVGCSKEPSKTQLELVDRLIQEQIDIPYKEPEWNDEAKDFLSKKGETVIEATERNKKLYTDMHEFLVALKNKPFKEKRAWAVKNLKLSIDLWEKTIESMESPLDMSDEENKEVILLFEQRKEWLAILKE